ncbi:MAG: hypothetical protein J6H18_00135, partial [Lachnospiraceae bacterium]|nr:hypothetical protein [Lachnospiraceae bacterium]
AGHMAAVTRAASHYSQSSYFNEVTGGLEFLRFITELWEHFEERADEIRETLTQVSREVFTQNGLIMNVTCEEKAFPDIRKSLAELASSMPSDAEKRFAMTLSPPLKEAVATTGAVGFLAHCGSFRKAGPYKGSLKVLQSILAREYLWQQLRVLGGAYGARCRFGILGPSYFVSYRDPQLSRTEEVYREIPAYVEQLDLPEEVLESFIIATIGGMDIPGTPSVLGEIDFGYYLSGIDAAFLQEERDAVIHCTLKDLHDLAPYMRAILETETICYVGSSIKAEEEKAFFDSIENL